jgi:hypothetical protein
MDADANTIRRMPTLKDDKGLMPILISLAPADAQDQVEEEDLYIITRRVTHHLLGFHSCFDVLKLGISGESEQWLCLPPPPFVDNTWYDDKYALTIIRS